MLHETLWRQTMPLAKACLSHPFVQGLGDGTLDSDAFRRYVAQDAFFLNAFARAYALAAAHSEDQDSLAAICGLLNGVLDELKLHANYAKELNIDLTDVKPYPQVKAYTDFLLAIAWQNGPGETIAAMTPCMRLYGYLGTELANAKTVAEDNPYKDWVATYSGPEFGGLITQLESLLDSTADDTPAIRDAYTYAMQCELNFFSAMFENSD